MNNIPKSLDLTRRIFKRLFHPRVVPLNEYIFNITKCNGQAASDLIKASLLDDKPLMVARLGTELYTVLNFKEVKLKFVNKYFKFIKGELHFYNWQQDNIDRLCSHSGFFPPTIQMAERFSELYIEEMKYIDIWGEFSSIEKYFQKELFHTKKIRLFDIEPFIHKNPWTEVLENKKVLIIHPFEESIISQYSKRDLLFDDKRVPKI
jgi:hypothetical protein